MQKEVYRVVQEGYVNFVNDFIDAVKDAVHVAGVYERTTHVEKLVVIGHDSLGRTFSEPFRVLSLDGSGVPYGQP